MRIAFNPNVTTAWFTSVMGIIGNVTMLAIILAGAAVIREREHGTMDHLLVMPVTPFEIAMSKVWANGLVITVAVGLVALHRRADAAGHPDRRLDPAVHGRRGDLSVLRDRDRHFSWHRRAIDAAAWVAVHAGGLPMNMLSGSNTPLESMPPWLATAMQVSPSTHFVSFAQAILYRGAGFDVVWPQFVAVALIGGLFFGLALLRFRSVVAQTT